MSEWIKIKSAKDLPDSDRLVLVISDPSKGLEGSILLGPNVHLATFDCHNGWDLQGWEGNPDVADWMDIPLPPK